VFIHCVHSGFMDGHKLVSIRLIKIKNEAKIFPLFAANFLIGLVIRQNRIGTGVEQGKMDK